MRSHSATLSGRPATIEEQGDGTPVVLVGAAVPMAWARPGAGELAKHSLRVINFDYSSDVDFGEPERLTCLGQIDDVIDVMNQLKVSSAHIVGLSRGAVTAYGLASRSPHRVRRLVLAFPVAPFEDVLFIEGEPPPVTAEMSPLEALDTVLDTAFSPEFLETNRQEVRDMFLAPPGSVVRVERDEEEPIEPHEPIEAPTLVISGGKDFVVTDDHPRRFLESIGNATHYRFPEAYHGFLMEQPDRFASVVAEFLNG